MMNFRLPACLPACLLVSWNFSRTTNSWRTLINADGLTAGVRVIVEFDMPVRVETTLSEFPSESRNETVWKSARP
jgi:hypothetical protein